MTLLEIRNLTIRFGGITAVKDFSLQVKSGEIVSIIGPNGAGKTTVFNAITGIYPPTAGEIRFREQVLAKPFTWRMVLGCLFVGLASSLLLGLLMANVDLLWYAAVRRPHNIEQTYRGQPEANAHRFSISRALGFAQNYLTGKLAVEPARRKWRIVSADGSIALLDYPSENEANAHLPVIEKLKEDESNLELLQQSVPLDKQSDFLQKLREIREVSARRKRSTWLGCMVGFVLGALGNFAIWNRSRSTPDVVSRGGIARTFHNIRLFHHMSVLENVLVGLDRTRPLHWFDTLRRWCGLANLEKKHLQEAQALLDFMGLSQRSDSLAKNLPYGDQRRLEIARAMATHPQLLLLDEPAAGMNPAESEELMHLIRKICERGMTILLIEHHMNLVMGISDRVAVLEYGEGIAEGTPAEVRANPKVIEAYLGKEEIS